MIVVERKRRKRSKRAGTWDGKKHGALPGPGSYICPTWVDPDKKQGAK